MAAQSLLLKSEHQLTALSSRHVAASTRGVQSLNGLVASLHCLRRRKQSHLEEARFSFDWASRRSLQSERRLPSHLLAGKAFLGGGWLKSSQLGESDVGKCNECGAQRKVSASKRPGIWSWAARLKSTFTDCSMFMLSDW